MPEPAIRFNNFSHTYEDGTEALNDVSFSVACGESLGLIGHNGSGKTTLLMHIVGILEPNSRVYVSDLPVSKIVQLTHSLGGVSVASHIDRESFSLIGQLGFIPEGLALDALEVSYQHKQNKNIDFENFELPLVTSSDAHYLSDIGRSVSTFLLPELSFTEMMMALQGVKGRKVTIQQ